MDLLIYKRWFNANLHGLLMWIEFLIQGLTQAIFYPLYNTDTFPNWYIKKLKYVHVTFFWNRYL